MKGTTENLYLGTSGLVLPVPNKSFYPDEFKATSRLTYYASLMNSIEINSSFYKIPQAATVKRWAAEVPSHFRFTFKLFKGITHAPNLEFDPSLVNDFITAISHVDDKSGCILVQFPPSIKIRHLLQIYRLIQTLKEDERASAWQIAFEFRDESLYVEEIYEELNDAGFFCVLHDKGKASSPLDAATGAPAIYLRFHGPDGNYRGSYPDEVLYEYASYISEWLAEDKRVFVYFNNTMGAAYQNLKSIQKYVGNYD